MLSVMSQCQCVHIAVYICWCVGAYTFQKKFRSNYSVGLFNSGVVSLSVSGITLSHRQ